MRKHCNIICFGHSFVCSCEVAGLLGIFENRMRGVDGREKQGGIQGWKGRGFRPNYPFTPSRRPGEAVHQPTASRPTPSTKEKSGHNVNKQPPTSQQLHTDGTDALRLLVKYSYQANESSPLGLAELTVQQGQNVTFVVKHTENDQWCKVRADDGQEGFVPSSYVMELESKLSTLPWLQKTNDTEDETENKCGGQSSKPIFKPYVPTYQENKYEVPDNLKNFFCKICNKQLNGIKPYNAHMTSKAHKEEMEYYEEQQKS